MGFFEKIEKVDPRYIYWTVIIIVLIPLLYPIGLPLPIDPTTREYSNKIKALPPDSVVVFTVESGVSNWPDVHSGAIATLKLLLSRPIKIVFFTVIEDGIITNQMTLDACEKELVGKTYGEDYVVFGFIPGGEAAVASLASDTKMTLMNDIYGTPIDQLQIMQNINMATDFDGLIVVTGSGVHTQILYLRHWQSAYNVPLYVVAQSGHVPEMEPYYASGQITALIKGSRGGAELELVTNNPGSGIKYIDIQSIAQLFVIFLIIVGNLGEIIKKLKGRGL